MGKQRCGSCFREYEGAVCPHCGYPEKGENGAHQLPVGTRLRGRYRLGKVLGQGGFGITYLAWDELMDTLVAVKEFYPSGTVFRRCATSLTVECGTVEMVPHYEYSRERFLREARALVKFKDIPEVVDILDFVEENNTAYIVMEFVKGMDLARYIQRKGGKLSVEETFRILKPVMEALAKVHKGGIVHRDISPDNIILDPMGGAKLLDFGAVRAVEDPDVDKGLNKSTEAILKQGFAPIEQYNTRGSLGPWTDEYAMCATVWYCLTGRIPEDASIRMAEGIDPDWSAIPGLPEHQQKALHKGISCRAKDRFESMDALLEALFPEEETTLPAAEPPKAEIPKKAEKPAKAEKAKREKAPKTGKKPFIWIAAAAALLIVIAAAVFLPGKREDSSPAQLQDVQGTLPSEVPGQTPDIPETTPSIPETVPPTEPLSEEEKAYLQAEQLLEEGKLGEAAIAFGKLAGYSDARERSLEIWDKIALRDTIGAGYYHTVGLKDDGNVVAVGYNEYGQCDVEDWAGIIAVSAGCYHTVGLKTDNTVIAIGDNSTDAEHYSGRCDVDSWTDIVAVNAGFYHTVGLRMDGTVIAAGQNTSGRCDVGEWTDIVMVSASNNHTVGLKADGTLVATGNNRYGQCDIESWTNIVAVSTGEMYTVGLKADGTLVAAGWNETNINDTGRCNVTGWTNIIAVDTYGHTVGLKADGTLMAVGYNAQGQCNILSWTDVAAVAAGFSHTVGLRSEGTVLAVGHDWAGQCDVSDWTNIRIPQRISWYKQEDAPAEIASPEVASDSNQEAYAQAEILLAEGKLGEAAIAFGKLAGYSDARERSFEIWDRISAKDTISVGEEHVVGIRENETVVAAGPISSWKKKGQSDVGTWTDIVAVSADWYHTVGLRADGTVVAVGDNSDGQCDVDRWTDIVAVSAGIGHTVGLRIDGTMVAVGWNEYGQCDVSGWSDIVAVSAGGYHTVGLRADGTLVAVGSNEYGQCDVSSWSDIVAVSAGFVHTVGLRADGTVVAVGSNNSGECDMSGWTDIVAVSAGWGYTVGLRADGTLVAVGDNYNGQCKVSGWANIVAVSANSVITLGLREDGSVAIAGLQLDTSKWWNIHQPYETVPFR